MQYAFKQETFSPANYYKVTDHRTADDALNDLYEVTQDRYFHSVLILKNDSLSYDLPIRYDIDTDEFYTVMFGSEVMRRDIQEFIGDGCIWELYAIE